MYRGFSPYANFITANFITAIFQKNPKLINVGPTFIPDYRVTLERTLKNIKEFDKVLYKIPMQLYKKFAPNVHFHPFQSVTTFTNSNKMLTSWELVWSGVSLI